MFPMSHQSAVAPRRGVMILTAIAMASEHMSITNTPVQSSPLEATPARSGPSAAPTEPVPVGRSYRSYLDHTGHSRHQVRDWGGRGPRGADYIGYNSHALPILTYVIRVVDTPINKQCRNMMTIRRRGRVTSISRISEVGFGFRPCWFGYFQSFRARSSRQSKAFLNQT